MPYGIKRFSCNVRNNEIRFNRFNINLQCGPNVSPRDDIALHLAVKLAEGYVARNTLDKQTWGDEQGQGFNPITPGVPFEILILCDQTNYKVRHFF